MVSASVVGVILGLPLALLHWLRRRSLRAGPAFKYVFVGYWSIIFSEWFVLTLIFAVK